MMMIYDRDSALDWLRAAARAERDRSPLAQYYREKAATAFRAAARMERIE